MENKKSSSLIKTYLLGFVRHRPDRRFWIEEKALPPNVRKIYIELVDLLKNGSEMSAEIIEHRLSRQIGMPGAQRFLKELQERKITRRQFREVYETLTFEYVHREVAKRLRIIADNIYTPGMIDEGLEEIRHLKSLQPVREETLGEQGARAIEATLDGHKGLIRYGIRPMDDALGGIFRKEVTILAGRPGHGKTSFTCCQLALNWVKAGYKVVIFSKEMSDEALLQKMISHVGYIDSMRVKRGDLDLVEQSRAAAAMKKITEKYSDRLIIFDNIYSVAEMETAIIRLQPDIVIDDYIQMSEMPDPNIRIAIGKIADQYKRIAKSRNIAFMVLSQMKRDIEFREQPVPLLSDLAESSNLEHTAADVIFITYPHRFDYNKPPDYVELYALKARYGTTGVLQLRYVPQYMQYVDPIKFAGAKHREEP